MSVDPMADHPNLAGYSPYHYTYNNPIRFIDYMGMFPMNGGPGPKDKGNRIMNKVIEGIGNGIVSAARLITGLLGQGDADGNFDGQGTQKGGKETVVEGQDHRNSTGKNPGTTAETSDGVMTVGKNSLHWPAKKATTVSETAEVIGDFISDNFNTSSESSDTSSETDTSDFNDPNPPTSTGRDTAEIDGQRFDRNANLDNNGNGSIHYKPIP